MEAKALAGVDAPRAKLAERLHALGAAAVVVTGGHGEPVDHLFDGETHVDIPVARFDVAATHGAGCTHSATLAALLARGESLVDAARGAAAAASKAVEQGLVELGAGDGPVDILLCNYNHAGKLHVDKPDDEMKRLWWSGVERTAAALDPKRIVPFASSHYYRSPASRAQNGSLLSFDDVASFSRGDARYLVARTGCDLLLAYSKMYPLPAL